MEKNWLANISSLTVHMRKCFSHEFEAFEASLRVNGISHMDITLANLEQCLLTFTHDASYIVPICISYVVLQCKRDADDSVFLAKAKVVVDDTWRMFFKNDTQTWKQLLQDIKK